jgi:hypothetical protein
VTEGPILRFLDLVKRELGASDARAEIGGRDPEGATTVYCSLPGGFRIVAVFDEPPGEPDELRARLESLAASFFQTASSVSEDRPRLTQEPAARRLDEELEALAARVGAVRAAVIDDTSPVLWGSSESRRGGEDVDTAIETTRVQEQVAALGLDLAELVERDPTEVEDLLAEHNVPPKRSAHLNEAISRIREQSRRRGARAWQSHLLMTRAIADVRRKIEEHGRPAQNLRATLQQAGFGYVVRSFATIYHLIVVFDGPFSELHAEAGVVHALPIIERLVLALPPSDPPAMGGRVLRMPRRRR